MPDKEREKKRDPEVVQLNPNFITEGAEPDKKKNVMSDKNKK